MIRNEYVRTCALAGIVIVRVGDAVPVNRETEDGLSANVEFVIVGNIVAFRSTLPAKLLRLLIWTVMLAKLP